MIALGLLVIGFSVIRFLSQTRGLNRDALGGATGLQSNSALATPPAPPPVASTMAVAKPTPLATPSAPTPTPTPQQDSKVIVQQMMQRQETGVAAKMKELLVSEESARKMLKQAEDCIAQLNGEPGDGRTPPLPPVMPPQYREQIKGSCQDIGKIAADAYPSLRDEYERKVLRIKKP